MSYVLGLDLGTSSLKALLLDRKGKVIANESAAYSIRSEQTGYSEENPRDWLEALDSIFVKLNRNVKDFQLELESISFSGQMHSMVLLDENMEVLRPAILWNDVRTTKQCKEIMKKAGTEVLRITKNQALEGFTLPKVLWVMQNESEIWEKTSYVLLPKDYLRWYLDGNIYTDYSDAAGTLMFDIKKKIWSDKILNMFSISSSKLPPVVNSFDFTGYVKEEIKQKYGFVKKVSVYAGAADNACAAIGSGLNSETDALVSIGTSGVFMTLESDPRIEYDGKLHFFNHAIKDSYYSMGVTLSAGASLAWFKKTFSPNQTFEELLSVIPNVPVGSKGLLFAPYIYGERTPYFDSKVRGSFVGIDNRHNFSDFVRAVIEGITFSLKDCQILLEAEGNERIDRVISVGGGSQDENWIQIQADIFNKPIVYLKSEQGPCLGAAMIAAMGMLWFDNLNDCIETFVVYSNPIKPLKENVELYKKIYLKYKEIYSQTKFLTE